MEKSIIRVIHLEVGVRSGIPNCQYSMKLGPNSKYSSPSQNVHYFEVAVFNSRQYLPKHIMMLP